MKFCFDSFGFVEQQKNAAKLAFACSNGDLSWSDLESLSQRYIKLFAQKGLEPGRPVIIYGHKQKEFPVLIVACLLARIPYVPVDETVPAERLNNIAAQISPSAVFNLTSNILTCFEAPVVTHEENFQWVINPAPAVYTNTEVAYLIFTSGSTGIPKGVIIPRRAVSNFTKWVCDDFPVNENTVFINQAPFSFDLSMVELMGNLALGSSTILNENAVTKDPEALFERIKTYGGNFWHSTPSFGFLCSTSPGFNPSTLNQLHTFLFIGEELTSRVVQRVGKAFPQGKIYNAYGPSEATYAVTICEITPAIAAEHAASLPVGYPKKDSGIGIFFDDQITEAASDQEGEIILSGENLALGYLDAVTTAEKFKKIKGTTWYFTGDYGFYKNGLLFFNGRRDEQVKLNGFRIELGEINQVLGQVNGVHESMTLPLKAGNQVKRIVSFIKPIDGVAAEKLGERCLDRAKQKLPPYMVPSEIVVVNDFPYNNNLKIDRNKLLEMYTNGVFTK